MPGYRFLYSRYSLAATAITAVALLVPTLFAVAQNQPEAEAPRDPVVTITEANSDLRIIEKFAKVVQLPSRIIRVDGFDPEVVKVSALSPSQIRVQASQAGVTSMVLTDENNVTYQVDILVIGDVRHLQAYINKLFPHSAVQAVALKGAVVLRGWVTQPSHINEIVEIADQFYPEVLNQMQLGGAQQVLLKCRILEVQRSKVRELGMNFLTISDSGYFASTPGPITPIRSLSADVGRPSIGLTGLANSTLTFGLINSSRIFQGFIKALKEEGLLKIKAEPVLVTTNGRPATLLQGGEFPIAVPAGLGTVGIEWREFGVRLEAVPLILGNGRLRLELQPEVSERDFSSQVTVGGVNVPGLTVRRANTSVEMHFGETLVIAGLISNRQTAITQKIPFIGDMPIIGAAFSRKRYEDTETELIIMVTPEYVAPLKANQYPHVGPGDCTTSPTSRELYFDGMIEIPKYGDDCQTPGCIGGRCRGCGITGCNGSCGRSGGGACVTNPGLSGLRTPESATTLQSDESSDVDPVEPPVISDEQQTQGYPQYQAAPDGQGNPSGFSALPGSSGHATIETPGVDANYGTTDRATPSAKLYVPPGR
jgi:pilus assembly protein CpaC